MKFATFALAACLLVSCGTQASDSCLVGTWKVQGNGAAEWMARNLRGMRLSVGRHKAMLRLQADSSYVSGVRLDARATLDKGDSAATHESMSTASKGRWHADGNRLLLEPQSEQVRGSIDFTSRSGQRTTRPVPIGGGGAMQMSYTCQGNEMVTRKTFPGIADPISQRYVRVH